MNFGLKRVTEKVKQATGLTGKGFVPTSNARNVAMLKEAENFAKLVKKCVGALKDLKNASEAAFSVSKVAMSSPLPHVFEENASIIAKPVTTTIGGPEFQPDVMTEKGHYTANTLETQVMVPINRWLAGLKQQQLAMKDLEALRLDVDASRHTVIDLSGTVEKLRAKLSSAGANAKTEAHLDECMSELQRKDGKLSIRAKDFEEKEQAAFEALSALIQDAKWLRHFMATGLRIEGENLIAGAAAFGETDPGNATSFMASLKLSDEEIAAAAATATTDDP